VERQKGRSLRPKDEEEDEAGEERMRKKKAPTHFQEEQSIVGVTSFKKRKIFFS
jgi:hypothetical protein